MLTCKLPRSTSSEPERPFTVHIVLAYIVGAVVLIYKTTAPAFLCPDTFFPVGGSPGHDPPLYRNSPNHPAKYQTTTAIINTTKYTSLRSKVNRPSMRM